MRRPLFCRTPRVETRIVDEHGETCGPGVPGELWIRGDNVVRAYFGEQGPCAREPGGFFATGDIVSVHHDGFHHVVDRKKDMFISGGENVYPAEIEAKLSGYPGLLEAAVVGAADARWGDVGHLAFVPEPGADIEGAALLRHLEARIARYKVPKHVTALRALPRTSSGKVLERELRAMLCGDTEA